MPSSGDEIFTISNPNCPDFMDERVEAAENRQMRRSQRLRAMISLLPMPFFSFLKNKH